VARDVATAPERSAVLRPSEPTTPSTEAGKGERTTGLAQLARGIVSRG
jgi:hypothetical protein